MKNLLLLFVLIVTVSCGGGGGGSSVTLPKDKLTGTYNLKSFEIIYLAGWHYDQGDYSEWSGRMWVSPNVLSTEYNFDGDIAEGESMYYVTYDPGHYSGVVHFADGTVADFSCDGYDVEVWFVDVDAGGNVYEETDVWHKVGDGF